jgi:hypothetical protein
LVPFFTIWTTSDSSKYTSEAIGLQCDVTSWEDQLRLFEAAIEVYRSVDIVVSYWSPSQLRSLWFIEFSRLQTPV